MVTSNTSISSLEDEIIQQLEVFRNSREKTRTIIIKDMNGELINEYKLVSKETNLRSYQIQERNCLAVVRPPGHCPAPHHQSEGGMAASANQLTVDALQFPTSLRASCVHSCLKWGSSIVLSWQGFGEEADGNSIRNRSNFSTDTTPLTPSPKYSILNEI